MATRDVNGMLLKTKPLISLDDLIAVYEEDKKKIKKSSFECRKFREEGEEELKKLKKVDSLVLHNKSLCHGKLGTKDLGLSFVKRSETCFLYPAVTVGLKNVELAKNNSCPRSLLGILKQYEDGAKDWLKAKRKPAPFSLQYERKGNTPNVDVFGSLILKQGQLITTKEFKVGDVIAVEHPFFGAAMKNSAFMNCANCLKFSIFLLIPCDGCTSTMFCSEKCKKEATEGYHRYECDVIDRILIVFNEFLKVLMVIRHLFRALAICGGSVSKLEELWTGNNYRNVLEFDYNSSEFLSNPKEHLLASFAFNDKLMPWPSSRKREEAIVYEKFLRLFPKLRNIWKKDGKEKKFVLYFLVTQARYAFSSESNLSHKCDRWVGGVYPLRSYMKTSCMPNVMGHFYDRCCVVYKAQQVLQAGTIITTQHGPLFFDHFKEERTIHYLECFHIVCRCVACTNKYSPISNRCAREFAFKKAASFDENNDYSKAELALVKQCTKLEEKAEDRPDVYTWIQWSGIAKLNIDINWGMNICRHQDFKK